MCAENGLVLGCYCLYWTQYKHFHGYVLMSLVDTPQCTIQASTNNARDESEANAGLNESGMTATLKKAHLWSLKQGLSPFSSSPPPKKKSSRTTCSFTHLHSRFCVSMPAPPIVCHQQRNQVCLFHPGAFLHLFILLLNFPSFFFLPSLLSRPPLFIFSLLLSLSHPRPESLIVLSHQNVE